MKKYLLTIAILINGLITFAQTPTSFQYQAVLRDASGQVLANKEVEIGITILQGSASGTEVFTETHLVTTNNFGLANLQIGSVNTVGMEVMDWGDGPYFVEVSVDGTVMGTSQLLSVPFAMHAVTVENDLVDDADADPENEIQDISLSGNELSISGGSTVILPDEVNDADADPTNELQVVSIKGDTIFLSDGGYIKLPAAFNGNFNNLTNIPPNLDMDATDDFDGQYSSLSGAPQNVSEFNNDTGYITNPDDADADPTNELQDISLNGTDLSITGGSTVDLSVIQDGTGTDNQRLSFGMNNQGKMRLNISDGNSVDMPFVKDGTDVLEWQGNNNYTAKWAGDGSIKKGSIFDNGNIGIGTNTPGAKLEVAGQVKITGGSPGSGKILTSDSEGLASWKDNLDNDPGNELNTSVVLNGTDLEVTDAGGTITTDLSSLIDDADSDPTNELQIMSISNDTIYLSNGGYAKLPAETDPEVGANTINYISKWNGAALVTGSIYDNDSIGIGTNTPTQKLEINGNTKADTMYASAFSSNSPLLLQTAGTTRIFANDTTGNVGIGTNSPKEKLEVDGAVNIGNSNKITPSAGTIRWNSETGDFEGFTGKQWKSLTKENSTAFGNNGNELIGLTANDCIEDDIFSSSVSISGDYAIVGASNYGSNNGSAYIFQRFGTEWVQQQKILANDSHSGDFFGGSVSISGDYAIVGACGDANHGDYTGSAYIFHRSGSCWVQQQKLTADDGAKFDYFGNSVSISSGYAIVGAYNTGNNSGSAYIFQRSGTDWMQLQKLTGNPSEIYFGNSVSISGAYAFVGNNEAVYIFQNSGANWTQQQKLTIIDCNYTTYFGSSVSISGDYAIVGAYKDNRPSTGSAYIYQRSDTIWTQQQKLTANDGMEDDYFGYSVSISGDYAIVGAPLTDENGLNSGSAYIFHRSGSNWVQQQKLTASDGAEENMFGIRVSISGDYAIVGAPGNNNSKGKAYIF